MNIYMRDFLTTHDQNNTNGYPFLNLVKIEKKEEKKVSII